MKENKLVDLSKQFAVDIVNLCTDIKENRKGNVLLNQLLRSGTSIGANIHEANYASSKADFINKFQIALKECYESDYRSGLFKDTKMITESEYKDMNDKIQIYENKRIRTAWNEETEEWYFSVVDVVSVLTDSKDPAAYWRKLKQRLKAEGNETVTNCHGLKMTAPDGKKRMTDVVDTTNLLRLVQSIPSPKAEPFKMWLAQVGKDRIEETIDPELAIDRALEIYLKKGYDEEWIHQRILSIRVRNELTAQWQQHGVEKGREYAILTDEITKAWSGMTTRKYKNLKGLTKENLRDNMSTTELILNMLAETSTTDISKEEHPQGLAENIKVAKRGGNVAKIARQALEAETGKSAVTPQNAAELNKVVVDLIEEVTGEKE